MSKPESRYIVTKSEHNGVPWSDVAVQRSPGMYTVYKLTEVARGTPAELAALEDPDAPVIEVVPYDEDTYVIVCGEYGWDGDRWNTGGHGDNWHFDYELDAMKFAALLRKHKDYPQADGGGA